MGGSRSRVSRKRATRTSSLLSVDLCTVCADLHSSLQATSADSELLTLLATLPHPPPAASQDQLGAAIHISVLRYPPASPFIRHRLAQLCCVLPEWHVSSPSAALSVFTTIANASFASNHSRDSAALSVSLTGVAAVARASLPSRSAREQVERHVPSLVEPVHVALFRPRSAPLADNTSDSGSGLYSDHDSSSSVSPRLHTVRYAALDALQALATVASRSLIPFWGMFLPDRDGVPRRAGRGRDTLASMLLFEKDTQLRSNAVSAVNSLLTSMKTFIQNATQITRPEVQQTALSFTSTSSRVLRSSSALHTVVASALPSESCGIVVAKLAKLAAELTSCMPVPAVSFKKFDIVIQALRSRLLDEVTTDLTSRAAAASAIAVALSKSGEYMPEANLERLCEELVEALKRRRRGCEQPVLELLGVLRSAVVLRPCLFRRILEEMELPLLDLAAEESTPGLALHCVRLVEAFLGHTVKVHAGVDRGILTDGEKRDLQHEVVLAWELYRKLLKGVMRDASHPAQAFAVSALGAIMHLTEFVHAMKRTREIAFATPGVVDVGKGEPFDLMEAIEILQSLAISHCSDGVRICALRSLASAPVKCLSNDSVRSILDLLNHVMRKEGTDLRVRGKAMSSFSSFIDKASRSTTELDVDIASDLEVAARFAADFLKDENSNALNRTTRVNKSSVESSDVAAVNLVACALRCTSNTMENKSDTMSAETASDHALVLSWVFRSDKSVNTKCMCCKAVGQILRMGLERTGLPLLNSEKVLVEALEWSLEYGVERLQIACANVLRDVMLTGHACEDVSPHLRVSIRVFEIASSKMKSNQVDGKTKMQITALQDTLAETVFEALKRRDEDVPQMLVESWRDNLSGISYARSLTDAVLRHLSYPGLLAADTRAVEEDDLVSELEEHVQLLVQTLPADSQDVIRQVIRINRLVTNS